MGNREPLLAPTGDSEADDRRRMAARPASLGGLRVGLLDNTKPNAAILLTEIGTQLQRHHGTATATLFTKSYFGTPVEQSQIQQIRQACDVVVAGVGD